MKAITIRQPWASLIALGVKTIETRSWPTKYRGRIAIHAGDFMLPKGRHTFGGYEVERDRAGLLMRGPIAWPYRLPLGAVIATATLADCVPMTTHYDRFDPECIVVGDGVIDHVLPPDLDQSASWGSGQVEPGAALIRCISDQLPYGDFRPGRWAWLLEDVQPIDPVPAKGRQGLWNWDGPA